MTGDYCQEYTICPDEDCPDFFTTGIADWLDEFDDTDFNEVLGWFGAWGGLSGW